MSSYIGRHAELYDMFYSDKPYAQEASFVHKCICEYSVGKTMRILELACGTGSHSLEFKKKGYNVVGVDYSQDMLSCAKKKAKSHSSQITFHMQDMRNLNLPEKSFDVVLCLFDSIGYVVSNEGLSSALRNIYEHLRSNGLFIFEFWHADAMIRNYEPIRVKRWMNHNREILRISETQLNHVRNTGIVTYTIYDLHQNGTYVKLKETIENRYFSLQEMSYWISEHSFIPVKSFAGFNDKEEITEDTWHIVSVARKT